MAAGEGKLELSRGVMPLPGVMRFVGDKDRAGFRESTQTERKFPRL